MNKIKILLLIPFYFFQQSLHAQQFPEEMKLSDDGRRLTLGGNQTTGFYDDTQVKIINAVFECNIEYYGKIIINNIFIILVTICMIIIIFYIVKNKYFQLTISMRKLNASEKTPVLIEE